MRQSLMAWLASRQNKSLGTTESTKKLIDKVQMIERKVEQTGQRDMQMSGLAPHHINPIYDRIKGQTQWER